MMQRLLLSILLLAALPAQALDFRSTANPAAILYDAPSTAASRLFVLSKGYPLEVVVSVAGWAKVRDSSGAMAWIETTQLSSTHTIVVRNATQIHTQAQDTAPISAQVAAGVILEWLENTSGGWAKVRLPDQSVGYIKLTEVWGA
ncbi:SH3 domain-containing protein [Sulfuriferula thiophila]|uniref:SH3 domain-containing protein n=1 Tax=Sulfuriferula thiophila TaxID=1781211 RepID=UPI000F6058E7|nr:SH3 domain-containing protein [Sulfuriferula thiophila]